MVMMKKKSELFSSSCKKEVANDSDLCTHCQKWVHVSLMVRRLAYILADDLYWSCIMGLCCGVVSGERAGRQGETSRRTPAASR